MSQLTLTPAEDVLVLNSVRAKYAQTLSAYGVEDADLVALLAKIEAQLTPVVAEVVVEAAPVVEEAPAKAKKAKAVEEAPVAEETPAE
jgi:hypothetical protein